ncbi:hypothetical protein RSAG8_10707, partial [Rhizoctonia solani AG-8 WAC10335]
MGVPLWTNKACHELVELSLTRKNLNQPIPLFWGPLVFHAESLTSPYPPSIRRCSISPKFCPVHLELHYVGFPF